MKANFAPWNCMHRLFRTTALLASAAMLLSCGLAQGATHKRARPAAPEGKTIQEAKPVQPPAPARRRLLTFYERFYPGAIRSFTTWW